MLFAIRLTIIILIFRWSSKTSKQIKKDLKFTVIESSVVIILDKQKFSDVKKIE